MKRNIFFSITYRVNNIIRRTKWYKEFWQGATKFWQVNTFNMDIVNLGSGAAVSAFDYSNIKVRGMNWALSPQSLIHDYNILRNYFSYLREGAIVIITICPFSCLFSQYNKRLNFKYYTFLHPATIIDFDDKERTKAWEIKVNPLKAMPIHCIKKTLKEFVSVFFLKFRRSSDSFDLSTSAHKIVESWQKQFMIQDLSAPLSSIHRSEQISRRETLDEIITFCKKRGLRPIIVIPPMHNSLTSLFSERFVRNYINNFLENVDAPIYDKMKNHNLTDDCFSSALLLNQKGARLFTQQLVSEIFDYKR